MEISANLVVSILALLVAIASAFYAKRAAEQAILSNKVNLHEPRKNVYEGLIRFRHMFGDYDLHPNDEEIQSFYIQVVLPATIYFPHEISARIFDVYKSSFDYYQRIEAAEYGRSQENKWTPINEFKASVTAHLDGIIPDIIAVSDVGHT